MVKGLRPHGRAGAAVQGNPKAVGKDVTQGFVTVLSPYGVFFRTLEPRPAKARAGVSISFGDRAVDLEAEVFHIVSFEESPFCEPGMAMKFVNITPEDSTLLRFFIYEQPGAGIMPSGLAVGQA